MAFVTVPGRTVPSLTLALDTQDVGDDMAVMFLHSFTPSLNKYGTYCVPDTSLGW